MLQTISQDISEFMLILDNEIIIFEGSKFQLTLISIN